MTVMEQKLNSNLVHETNKFQMINLNQNDNANQSQMITNEKIVSTYSRKNSATGSSGIPASNLSLSSTSSAGSSSKYNDSKFKKFSNNSFKNYDSTPPQTSRRASGNSITIRITNETNDNIEDESLNKVLNEIDSFDKQDSVELEDRGYGDRDRDRDEAEDTTSESTSNELISNLVKQTSKKKLKDRRKLVRSSAQQQHHLLYQESEDQIEEELKSNYNSLEEQLNEESLYPNQSMNSAFDELFAAAETGNSSISAIVEAKMAAVTHAHEQVDYEGESQFLRNRNSFISRSRNGSFRTSNKKGQSIDESKFVNFNNTSNHNSNNNSSNNESTSTINKAINNKKNSNNALNVETNLGAPQLLTRSCSCKRPGSFKKMKAKNSGIAGGISPSRINQTNTNTNTNNNNNTYSKINTSGPLMNNSSSRRGTQCSIILPDSLDKNSKLAGSLPFDNSQLNDDDAEVYRVRQFNITNKGSVINRGDSFKRSFKRSNNSLSSTKKELSPIYYEGNTLNLPEYSDGFNKSSTSSNCGLNETNTNNDYTSNSNESYGNNMNLNELNTNNNVKEQELEPEKQVEPVKNFLVYVIGSTGVGKNALIKQFKTSEYRGTYDLDTQEEDPNEGVNVLLDGVESVLQFMSMEFDMMKAGVISISEITKDNDAFIVVYSITDKSSYLVATDLLKSIRMNDNCRPVILVGNKSDLVRKRSVNRDDARNMALKYGCKFVETSVAINDKVDDLLAGILKQIRLKESLKNQKQKQNINENEMTTSFIETNISTNLINSTRQQSTKRHTRNYSDANLDMIKKTNKTNANLNSTMSFRANTLTRRLFRSKNKENIDNNDNAKFKRNQSLGANSFFHKIFNNIFKKKSNTSHLNSVENLYTPPVFAAKSKK